ncbi:hypothetical protein LTR86_008977 [Recurvomyces mirabilis]|nr:hypothetical protein LTR86_008977 [Recurvomyces mirabilis]
MGTDPEILVLLERATTVLLEIAGFYVSGHADAVRARKKVQQRLRRRRIAGQPAFHAALLSRLTALHDLLKSGLDKFDLASLVPSDAVQLTLDMFAELADDGDALQLERHSAVRHLIEAHDHDKLILGPRRLGHRICLFCPSVELQNRLLDQLLTCQDAVSMTAGNHRPVVLSDPASVLVDTEGIEEWRGSIDITQAGERLHDVLSQHITCHLHHEHNLVRVSALPILRRGLSTGIYTVCMREEKPESTWHTASLELLDSRAHIQETISRSKKVHFLPPQSHDHLENKKFSAENDTEPAMLCDMLYRTTGTALRANHTTMCRNLGTARYQPPTRLDLVSLRDVVGSHPKDGYKQLSKKERIEVAVVLSYAYLHLCETVWWPADHIELDLWLPRFGDRTSTNSPFLDACSRPSAAQSAYSLEWYMNDQRPSLPAFGKLLLEVWKGGAVDWKDLRSTVEECNDDPIGAYWMCAVNACLGDDLTLRSAGSVRALGQIRSNYVHKVVKSLQWLLEKLCLVSVDALMARDLPECVRAVSHKPDKVDTRDEPSIHDHESGPVQANVGSPVLAVPGCMINVRTMELEHATQLLTHNIRYAILSHRWGKNEVLYEQWGRDKRDQIRGWAKIQGACRQALTDGINYLWVDTCCIDRRSSAELNEAINSMFSYYEHAEVCYVYLADVSDTCQTADHDIRLSYATPQGHTIASLRRSEWFRRGWTLQELLAPTQLRFYDANWNVIGDLENMTRIVSDITGIDSAALDRTRKLDSYSYAQRLSWAACRKTTKVEDEAYCLLGILGTSLEVKYGIGRAAFVELQRKLLESGSGDDSLFLWSPVSEAISQLSTFFAPSPANFLHASGIEKIQRRPVQSYFHLRSDGVGARVYLYHYEKPRHGWHGLVALLNCTNTSDPMMMLGLCLVAVTKDSQATQFVVSTTEQAENRTFSARYVSVSRQCLQLASPRDITIAI